MGNLVENKVNRSRQSERWVSEAGSRLSRSSSTMLILIQQLEATPWHCLTRQSWIERSWINDDCAAPAKGLLQETLRQIPAR